MEKNQGKEDANNGYRKDLRPSGREEEYSLFILRSSSTKVRLGLIKLSWRTFLSGGGPFVRTPAESTRSRPSLLRLEGGGGGGEGGRPLQNPADSSVKHEMRDFLERSPPECDFSSVKAGGAAPCRAPAQMFGLQWDSNSLRQLEARW